MDTLFEALLAISGEQTETINVSKARETASEGLENVLNEFEAHLGRHNGDKDAMLVCMMSNMLAHPLATCVALYVTLDRLQELLKELTK
jgi:hypothetical protein